MKMNSLCRTIKPDEQLNYSDLKIILGSQQYGASHLTVYPFTNCYPFDRQSEIRKWDEVACKIFHPIEKQLIQLEDENIGLVEKAYQYSVEYYNDNGKFKITAIQERILFNQDLALKAIKKAMVRVIDIVNEVIESAWMHSKMLECFPEFNTDLISDLIKDSEKLHRENSLRKNDIDELEKEIYGVRSFTMNDEERNRLPMIKRIESIENNIAELREVFAKRKRPRR